MKIYSAILILSTIVLINACKDSKTKTTEKSTDSTAISANNSTAEAAVWMNDFRKFQTAVASNDAAGIKQFFKFPFTGDNNQIWFFVSKTDADRDKIPNDPKAFTEKDFDNNFDTLFSKQFKTALAKIDTDGLAKKGETETADITYAGGSYKMNAFYDSSEKRLHLLLLNTMIEKDEKGVEVGKYIDHVQYTFDVTSDGHLVFKQLTTPNAA